MKALAKALSLGFEIALSLAMPILIGVACDNHFNSKPIGILLGVAVAMGLVIRVLVSFVKST